MNESPISILLVDDDPDACAIFQLVMNHYQLPLKIVGDAETALEYLRSNNPDVVVIDIFLPDLDGYQALNQIRNAVPTTNSKFVATTAYYTNETPQETLNRGFDGYILKPFDSTKLVSYLRGIVHQDPS